jgi:hypothetical protein
MKKLRNVLLACALSVGALGAAVLPAAAQVYGGVYVQTGPPAAIYETVPVSPGPAYFWVGGFWNWNGYRYVWVRGHYAYRPYAHAVWHGGYWAHGPHGYYWRGGRWVRPPY